MGEGLGRTGGIQGANAQAMTEASKAGAAPVEPAGAFASPPSSIALLKEQCNRYANGQCQLRKCLIRGGWVAGEVDYDKMTAQARKVVVSDAGVSSAPESDAALQAFVADPQWVHYVALSQRPGVHDCCATLESTHYDPLTPANDLFQLRMIDWGGLSWLLISIPLADAPFMERAAAAHGLRVANGGVPTMVGPDGMQRFPADNKRVLSLENVSGHPVYKHGWSQ